ncbi:MAG: hypothetical protein AB1522_16540 [Chloroflexota bacterium]
MLFKVCFESTDGCGKDTQISLLREKVEREGFCTAPVKHPGHTAFGVELRRFLVSVILDTDMPGSELLYYVRKRLEPDVRVIDVRARNYSGGKLGV